MALIRADRVKESSTSTGTGAFTLAGADSTYRTFASVCAVADTVYYAIAHRTSNEWEVGLGTYSATNTLTRTTVHASSNANAAVSFSAGTKDVMLALTKAQLETYASLAGTETLTNKTISGASNTITNVSLSTGVTGTLPLASGGTGATTGTAAAANLVSSAPNDGLEYTLKSKKTNGTVSYYWVDSTGYAPTVDLLFAADRSLTSYSGPTPSFSRASTGTYFNSSGVLTSATINAARFNYAYNGTTWVSKGLLIEEQRTNTCLRSQDLTATWSANRGSITSNTTTAPDGTLTADRFVENTATGVHGPVQFDIVTTSGAASTASGFFKAGSRSVIVVRFQDNATGLHGVGAEFNLSNGTISVAALTIGGFSSPSASITDVGNGWYRCSVTGTVNTTLCSLRVEACTATGALSSGSFTGSSYTGDGSSYFDSWGYQMEAGSFPTSYIPTTTAAVTRSADVCQITGLDFSGFWNATEGSIAAEIDSPASGTRPISSADDNTANKSMILFTSGADPKFSVTDGGVSQADIDAGSISANTNFKLSTAFKANDFSASVGGSAAVTDASGTVPSVDRLRIGANQAGNYLNGHIARWRYYPVRLPNATLQVLST